MRRKQLIYFTAAALFTLIGGAGFVPSPAYAQNPSFAVDASWPKPLPAPVTNGVAHTWVTGEIAGTCVAQNDHVFTFNRAWEVGLTQNGVLQGNESGAIDGNDATASAIPSPPVVEYDSEGNTVSGWGNPSLIQSGADYGYAAYMPHGAHGCYVDYTGMIWVGGNGDGIVQEYNPQTAADAYAAGLGASVPYVMQIGTKGMCDGTATTANPFSSCNESNDLNSSHTLLNEPADIAVDPSKDPITGKKGSIYIADGYGNHRVVVFDSNGNYLRQWGQTCMLPNSSGVSVPSVSQSCPPGTFGATGGGHPHCVVLANDGYIYVCDRPDSRIQVFDRSCGAASVPSSTDLNTRQPLCLPISILNINGFDKATDADAAAILLAGTRGDDMDFWPNIDYLANKSPTNQNVIVDVDLGNDNTWLIKKSTGKVFGALGVCGIAPCPGHNAGHFAFAHTVAVDSVGDIYVAETITGRRIQKFVPVSGD
jgi:hypothetical protein